MCLCEPCQCLIAGERSRQSGLQESTQTWSGKTDAQRAPEPWSPGRTNAGLTARPKRATEGSPRAKSSSHNAAQGRDHGLHWQAVMPGWTRSRSRRAHGPGARTRRTRDIFKLTRKVQVTKSIQKTNKNSQEPRVVPTNYAWCRISFH